MTRKAPWPAATTLVAGVIGDPVRHSLSPSLHNAAYAALGLDWAYAAFPVAPGDVPDAIAGALALGLRGLSVTTPHKEAAAAAADGRSSLVVRLGAANTIRFRDHLALAESTDGVGLLDDLSAAGFDPAGERVAVIGAGGAARAAVLALAEAGAAEVVVVNRNRANAEAAAALAGDVGRTGALEELAEAALVVQATPLGMARRRGEAAAGDDSLAASLAFGERVAKGQLAYDLIYDPPETPFLATAAANGATVRNGLGMLVHQAAHQFVLFTGEPAPLPAMWAALGGEPPKDVTGDQDAR